MRINYHYVFTKQKDPTMEGEIIKETSRMLKDVTKHSKGKYTYVHIYKATETGWEYIKTEYGINGMEGWLKYVKACNESSNDGLLRMMR